MQAIEAEDYGDDKIELKAGIGELVRRFYSQPARNPDRFIDLKYKLTKNIPTEEHPEKYYLFVTIYHMDMTDSRYNIKQRPKKYKHAVENDYLSWWERRKRFGTKPREVKRRMHM